MNSAARVAPNFRAMVDYRPTSVKRCLFGDTDHNHVRAELRKLLAETATNDSKNWNFDFSSGRPLAGRYQWEPVCTPLIANVRQNVFGAQSTIEMPQQQETNNNLEVSSKSGKDESFTDMDEDFEVTPTRSLSFPTTKDLITKTLESSAPTPSASSPVLTRSMSLTDDKSFSQSQITDFFAMKKRTGSPLLTKQRRYSELNRAALESTPGKSSSSPIAKRSCRRR